MSFSGTLLILMLFLEKRFLKDKISRQWQYYIWLIIIMRLLLPFGAEVNLMGKIYQTMDQVIIQDISFVKQKKSDKISDGVGGLDVNLEQNNQKMDNSSDSSEILTPDQPFQDIVSLLINHIWLIWLMVMLGMLIRKVTIYQSFIRYVNAGLTPVSDIEILDQLSVIEEQAGIKRQVELCINPLISSPLLIGFFHPCIVLPSSDISEKDFRHIVLHELTHYKRGDMFYKWLVQITVCLHWFNPLVYLMSREITKECEFSCDEAVLVKIGDNHVQDYGKTLLDAMAAVGKYKETFGVVTLSENKQLLKERIGAIMSFKKKSRKVIILTSVLTVCIIFITFFIGVYPVEATTYASSIEENKLSVIDEKREEDISFIQIERYYEDGSLPLFQIAFSRLDEEAQSTWLNRIYEDEKIAFFSISVNQLKEDSSLIQLFAEKTYTERSISFFSVLTDRMSEEALEIWLDRALEDRQINFQSILFKKLDRDDELDDLEKQLEAQQLEEYQSYGVTNKGKAYYYKGQLVHIFLDIRKDSSFYTLDINPQGIVNIKITRNEVGEIKSVNYMTEEEVEELLGSMYDPDDELEDSELEVIPIHFETIESGEVIWLGEYTLCDGDKIWYDVLAETGSGMEVGFVKAEDTKAEDQFPDTTYYSVCNYRKHPIDGIQKCIADFTFGSPVKPGTYKLFLRAINETLRNVKGSISIECINVS